MKKIISTLMAIAMSLMVTTIVFAEESPVIKIEPYAIPAEEIGEYGAIENYDAYLLNIYMSGVDANRTSGNTVTGRVMAAFELTFTAENSDIIDWENSYVFEPTAGVDLVQGTKSFQIKSGEPTRNASFPAKGQTISADEETLFASVLIYIPEGESLAFDVKDLSLVFSTYSSGSISDSSLTKIYDIKSETDPITCTTRSLSLGESTPEPTTATEVTPVQTQDGKFNRGFKVSLTGIAGKTGIKFNVTTNDNNVETKTVSRQFPMSAFIGGTAIESATTDCTVGLNVTGVPSGVTVTATAEAY